MATAGVERAVPCSRCTTSRINRYLVDCRRAHPGRFAGVGLIDHRPAKVPGELERLVRMDGLVGLRIHLGRGWR